ncbi:hypothetical protein AA313_de0200217 [Arthrobotrys entomopaga]|nr:hypothetical protein AA313_de0200217 [Arthrobotrys entomopaga]
MTSTVTKFVLGRIFKESVANKQGRDDPYFEYPAEELNKAGKRKSKRRKKALPPGLTDEEGEILTKVKRRAYRIDMSFGSFLGIRFGWGSIIGLVPAIGDVVDCFLALLVVKTCMKLPLPTFLLIHMLINVAFDFAIGLIPFIGDLADAGYKCNTRNAVLLEKHLRKVGQARLKAEGITDAVDNSLPTGEDSPAEDEEVDLEAQAPAGRRGNRNRREQERERERERERDSDRERDRDRERDQDRRQARGDRRGDISDSDRREPITHSKSKKKGRDDRYGGSEDSRRGGSRR